jgi:two-component system response regulator AtoC
MPSILVVDPDPQTAEMLEDCRLPETEVTAVPGAHEALDALEQRTFDVVVADAHLPGLEHGELITHLRQRGRETHVVLVAAFGSVEDAVVALRGGAADFLQKPFTGEQLGVAVRRALENGRLVRENRTLRHALDDRLKLDNFVSSDPRMQRIFKTVGAVAGTRSTVLITGESGTGKTLLARALHRSSDRAKGPFIEVNCGAMPENLLESELFGHVRGSFTGAVRDRPGKFEEAHGGTIFLDEIGTSSPSLQVKLLRVLQDRIIERVGESRTIPVDVRVVLATNLDLATEVREGRFREDLYYRIHVIAVEVPPLRARPGDIGLLAEHFLRRFVAETGRPIHGIRADALTALERARWPGNVRQLENVLERAVVLCEHDEIGASDLPPDLDGPVHPAEEVSPMSMLTQDAHLLPLKQALEGPERTLIQRALDHYEGNRQRTAESLGINRSTLFNKMRRLGIS